MLIYILFIIGFIILVKGADFLVDGASSLAKKLKIPAIVIGLTIVAFGTSTPELVVNVFSSISGNSAIAIGNILGSNIANILLILGVSAFIYPLSVTKNTTKKEIPLSILAGLSIFFMANDMLFDGASVSILTRIDGVVLLLFFSIFLYYTFSISKPSKEIKEESNIEIKEYAIWKSILFIILGLVALVVGGKWIVDGATHIARLFNVSESIIGLTIVAIGTSLPELATSAVAAMKKNSDIAIGNVVGSNIFNIFFVLGVSSFIKPLPFNFDDNLNIIMTILTSLLLLGFVFIGKKYKIEKWQGVVFVLIYIAYIIFSIFR